MKEEGRMGSQRDSKHKKDLTPHYQLEDVESHVKTMGRNCILQTSRELRIGLQVPEENHSPADSLTLAL